MLAGKKHKLCAKCWDDEENGIKSFRKHLQFELEDFDINKWQQQQQVYSYQLYTSTLCNLKCRICSEVSSSKWRFENAKELDSTVNNAEKVWEVSCDQVFDEVLENINYVKYLHLLGGEPLLNKRQNEFVKQIANSNSAKNIHLKYVSNGTIDPANFFSVWDNFKSVTVSLSIDDINERFEYQRHGSTWETAANNIKKLVNRQQNSKNFNIDVLITVSIFNVYYLHETIATLTELGVNNISVVTLLRPAEFNIKNLPLEVSEKVAHIYETNESLWPKHLIATNQSIKNILQNNTDSNILSDLNNRIRKIDFRRDEDFSKTHAEIAALIGYTK